MTLTIKRTRLVEEFFRIGTKDENDALELLAESDMTVCQQEVDQIGLSTLRSDILIIERASDDELELVSEFEVCECGRWVEECTTFDGFAEHHNR
jgi:hypothetical protein